MALTLGEAQALLAAESFDLVLLDIALGADSADAHLPLFADTKVVVVSGRSPEELPAAFARLPLLAKPFHPQDVAAILEGWRSPGAPEKDAISPP